MPNYIEIGEVGIALAREQSPRLAAEASALLSAELTGILKQGRVLAKQDLPGLTRFMSAEARRELPQISRYLGLANEAESGTLIIGRPMRNCLGKTHELVIYEPNRNITIFGDGSLNVMRPSPSGERVVSQNLNVKGPYADYNQRLVYGERFEHSYQPLWDANRPGLKMRADVVTRGDTRQFVVGTWGWQSGQSNFMPVKEVIDAVQATRPVDVSSKAVAKLMGLDVSNPIATGSFLGFDKTSGEAIVRLGDYPSARFEWWHTNTKFVKNLDGFYPVELNVEKATPMTAYRDAVGHLFDAKKVAHGYELAPADPGTYAFKPSELRAFNGLTVSEFLGIDSKTGLRAMGGYETNKGGRIAINVLDKKPVMLELENW